MKKYLLIVILALAVPTITLAAFRPATLTNGVKRIAVYSQEQAQRLFGQGYVLEGTKVGGFYSPDIVGKTENVVSLTKTSTSTRTLKVTDSGSTFVLSGSSTSFTLPAVATSKGVKYRFILGGDLTTASSTITSAEGDNLEGSLIVAGAVVDCDAADVLTIGSNTDNIGDYVELMSNGSKWFPLSSGALTATEFSCSG